MDEKTGAKVLEVAKTLVGSHYIHGAYGATPGLNDGCPCRPGEVGLIADEAHLDPKVKLEKTSSLAVNAATTTILHPNKGPTYSVCAGNYAAPLSPKYPGNVFPPDNDPDLIAYLDSLKGKLPSTWPKKEQYFTPRRTFGPGQNGGDGNGLLVWGELCKDKKHFDCVGFVSYCYWKASGNIVQLAISEWRVPNTVGKVYLLNKDWKDDEKTQEKYKGTIGQKPAGVMDGDILIKADHHIAFVGKNNVIYEAQDSQYGVCATPGFDLASSGSKWTHLVRVTTAGAAEQEWPTGWWRVWDGSLWYYYLGRDNVAISTRKGPVYDTIRPPAEWRNKGTWVFTEPRTLVITWNKLVAGAKEGTIETFWNADKDSKQINATSTVYTPLVANWMK